MVGRLPLWHCCALQGRVPWQGRVPIGCAVQLLLLVVALVVYHRNILFQ